jgi:hypothetical protein
MKKDNKIKRQSSPAIASAHWDMKDDSKKDMIDYLNIYNKLDLKIRYGLISSAVSSSVLKIANKFNIEDEERIGEISRIVREVFTRHINEEDIIKRVVEKLKISRDRVGDFMADLKVVLALVKKEGQRMKEEEARGPASEIMAIGPAMKKYKEVGEQLISLESIKLEIFKESVRPSIKNWLEDYRETMGTEKSSIQRSSYLFTSGNAKGLNPEDRKKVSLILKSHNDNVELVINSKEKQIDFERSLKREGGNHKKQSGASQESRKSKDDDIFIESKKSDVLKEGSTREVPDVKETGNQKAKETPSVKIDNYKKPEPAKKISNDNNKTNFEKKELKKKTDSDKPNNLLDLSDY